MARFSVKPLGAAGVLLITPARFADERGYFAETFRADLLAAHGVTNRFIQDNESLSRQVGTVRGLHFQVPPQAKLLRVMAGAVFDVAVDLRADSPDYGAWVAATLTASGGEQIFVPAGFAHGFCTLEPDTLVSYKVDAYYAPEGDGGLFWNDPELAIDWPVTPEDAVVSGKDARLPRLAGFASPFRMDPG